MDQHAVVAHIDKDHLWTPDLTTPKRTGLEWEHYEIEEIYGKGVVDYVDGVTQVRFRLLDDDDIPYYGGWLIDDDEGYVQMTLLDWGRMDAGCTTVEVKKKGLWVREIG